jgi:drug/metabolite transporter (DMT)-like permease
LKPQVTIPAWAPLAALLAADIAVFLLQKGASRGEHGGSAMDYLLEVAKSPLLWCAVAMTPVQLWLWTTTLRRADLGWAYAVTALSYPLTMVVATVLFSEHYDWHVWAGAALITGGAMALGPAESGSGSDESKGEMIHEGP